MMKRTLLSILLALCVLIVNGQSKISPYTQSFLYNHLIEQTVTSERNNGKSLYVKAHKKGAIFVVDAFVELTEGASIDAVIAEGATIATRIGDIITIQAPVDKIIAISELDVVKKVSVGMPVTLNNDIVRDATKVSTLHAGTGFDQKFTGKDIIVGGVDMGYDVNHIAFADQDGVSRVKRVYFPTDNTGKAPAGIGADGNSYPGSEYTTAEEISKLTTDTKSQSHGSHTMGIATGAYKANGYYGMAPEADIVMVGTPEFSDVNIVNGVAYMFDYAKSVNKPIVVNLSLGGDLGPHDGSSLVNKCFDALANKGNVIIISAGNSGSNAFHINKTFSSTADQLKTFILDYNNGSRIYNGYIDAWSRTETPVGVKVVVYNTTTNSIVYESKEFKPEASGGYFGINSSIDADFAKYYNGYVIFMSGVEDNGNGKYNCVSVLSAKSTKALPDYRLGLIYTSEANATVDIWADNQNTYLSAEKVADWTDGSSLCSINNMATSNSVISVGAYSTRNSFLSVLGNSLSIPNINLGDIADFSSSGIDMNGVSRPDVVAPGNIVLSAVNSFDSNTVRINRNILADEIPLGARKHHWGVMAGTSMSAPAVTGIVALWLQADPMLDAARVREILNATSVKDSYVNKGNPVQWGAGKIDANAGLIMVLKTSGVEGVVTENNAVIIYPNPSNGQFTVYAQGETGNVTLSVYSTNGSLMTAKTFDASQGEINIDLSSELSSGLYIVQLIGEKVNHTSRLIIK